MSDADAIGNAIGAAVSDTIRSAEWFHPHLDDNADVLACPNPDDCADCDAAERPAKFYTDADGTLQPAASPERD